jgi:ketol-acid reductoisomerase
MYEEGITGMRYSISDTAEYGDVTRGPRVITPATKKSMQKILKEIQTGKFAREWVAESESGRAKFNELRAAGEKHPIEEVGKRLRSMMPWLSAGKQKVSEVSGG